MRSQDDGGNDIGPSPEEPGDAPADGEVRELYGEVIGRIREERGPAAELRSLATRARIGLILAAVASMTGAILWLTPRSDLALYPPFRLAIVTLLFALLIGGAVVGSLHPLHKPPRPAFLDASWIAAAVLAPAVLASGSSAAMEPSSGPWIGHAAACFGMGAALALPLLLLWALLHRRGSGLGARVLLAAAAAALAGTLMLELRCALDDPRHVLIGHGTLVLTFVLAAALVALRRNHGRRPRLDGHV